MHLRKIILTALLATTAGGCGADNSLKPSWTAAPNITVHAVRRVAVSDAGAALQIDLSVEHANDNPVPLIEAKYTLTVDGNRYTTATHPNAVAAVGRAVRFTLPAVLSAAAGDRYTVTGHVRYKPPGQFREVLTDLSIPLPTTAFEGSGQITDAAATVAVPGPGEPIQPEPEHVPLAPQGLSPQPPPATTGPEQPDAPPRPAQRDVPPEQIGEPIEQRLPGGATPGDPSGDL